MPIPALKLSRRMVAIPLALAGFLAVSLVALVIALALSGRPDLLSGVSFGSIVLDSRGGQMKMSLSKDDKYRLPVSLVDVAPLAVDALLAYEDKYFYKHPGVNPFSLARAALASFLGDRKFGASTITMQVARLRYKLNTASIAGKLRQIWLALVLEYHYGKDEILEAYFNLAPYGANIEGVEAASRIYFNKPASDLTPAECHALTVIPQNPVARNPLGGKDFDRARLRLAALMAGAEKPDAIQPLMVRSPANLPFMAPHLSTELLHLEPTASIIRTCIEPDLQKMLEAAIRRHIGRERRYGLENASAILVNCADMSVVALAGSADFFSARIQGQVDGSKARRSPGSTLKPFIYGLALERGLIHPLTILPDSPRSFGGYDPENFDKGFRGPLSATDALQSSRNLPAIYLAEVLKYPDLYGFLENAGIRFPHGRDHYGLSLALGGAEISMRELASLYAMLANSGIFRPLRLTRDTVDAMPRRLFSPEAAFLVLRMLKRRGENVVSHGALVPVYYKTGTSNGFRDAWTAGVVGDYILVVWLGNFDNSPNPYFVGATAALPLFREIAANLGMKRKLVDRLENPAPQLGLATAKICVSTGDPDNGHCGPVAETQLIPGVSPIRDSGVLRQVLIDKDTGLRACAKSKGNIEETWMEFWPTDMVGIFQRAGIQKPVPPPWSPECASGMAEPALAPKGAPPRIILPKKNVAYHRGVGDQSFSLPLLAAADPDIKVVYWYAGRSYLGSSKPGEVFFGHLPDGGSQVITVIDENGGAASLKCGIVSAP